MIDVSELVKGADNQLYLYGDLSIDNLGPEGHVLTLR